MGRIRREEKYVGDAIRNKLEEGDDALVALSDGAFIDGTVEVTHDSSVHDREVVVGEDDGDTAVALVVNTEEVPRTDDWGDEVGSKVAWEVFAYYPDETDGDDIDVPALHIVGENMQMPDMTAAAAEEEVEAAEDVTVEMDEFREYLEQVTEEVDALLVWLRKVEDGEMTLREWERNYDTLEVKEGGRLALDSAP